MLTINSISKTKDGRLLTRVLAVLVSVFLVAGVLSVSAYAAVTVSDGATSTASTGNFSTSCDADAAYVAATNTFTDGPTVYYLVTQDATKSTLTTIDYQGVTYPLQAVVVGTDINAMMATNPAGQVVDIFAPNNTLFFDSGVYVDSNPNAYTRFSVENLSLVGLFEDANGDPTASLTKVVRADGTGTIERNIIMNKNVYLENLTFDGLSRNMFTNPAAGPKNRGEYFFYVSGRIGPWDASDGLVMKNCVIQNVGASNMEGDSKNLAINIYSSNGQHNFEGLTIRNVKTVSNLGVISMNRATNNYFKDLTIDSSAASPSALSIKIEDTDNGVNVPYPTYKNVFAGTLSLTQTGNQGFVYIERYQYARTYVPAAYRYACYSIANGSAAFPAITANTLLPDASSFYAVLDLTDNYWVVRSDTAVTVESQIAAIQTILSRVSSAGVPGSVPGYNMKLTSASGSIKSFAVPNLGSESANLVAVALDPSGNPGAYISTELLPMELGSTINLKSTNASGIKIYNIDFDALSRYTLQDAVSGVSFVIPADPNESDPPAGYPIYSQYAAVSAPKVIGSTVTTFANCNFSSLAAEITIKDPAADLGLTQSATFDADITQGYTLDGMTASSQTVSDPSILWFSSDPNIVSIDSMTGVATAKAIGTVTITAKAADGANSGEIEKPYASFTLQVLPLYQVSYDGNNNDTGVVPTGVAVVSGRSTVVPGAIDLVRSGYTWNGWNTMPDGGGTTYAAGAAITVEKSIVLYANWVKNTVPTGTPTPTVGISPTPGPTVTPTMTPSVTGIPTLSPTPTPDTDTLGVTRRTTVTPTVTPPTGVLSAVKTGEVTNPWMPATAITLIILISAGSLILIVRRRRA